MIVLWAEFSICQNNYLIIRLRFSTFTTTFFVVFVNLYFTPG